MSIHKQQDRYFSAVGRRQIANAIQGVRPRRRAHAVHPHQRMQAVYHEPDRPATATLPTATSTAAPQNSRFALALAPAPLRFLALLSPDAAFWAGVLKNKLGLWPGATMWLRYPRCAASR